MQFTRPWYDLRTGEEGQRRLDVAVAMSALLHAAALFLLVPQLAKNALTPGAIDGPVSAPISVSLAPRARPPQPPVEASAPSADAVRPTPAPRPLPEPRRPPPPRAALPPQRSPEVFRSPEPAPVPLPAPIPEARVEPRPSLPPERRAEPPPSPPVETDLAAYIAARRAERGESAPAVESDAARRDRALQRNLASLNAPRPFAGDPKSGGGLFQVTLKSYDFAEFRFYGWNRDVRRTIPQRFEVRKGANPTIDIAIVKRMVEIIRETERGDFVWRSERLGRDITLSARPEDNDRLEQFLLKDLFG